MDPPLVNEGSFSAINPSLEEIWPFNGENSQILGLRMGSGGFATGFMDSLLNNNIVEIKKYGSIAESSVTEQRKNCCVNVRKRRENVLEDDESSKVVSTTCSGKYLKNSNGKRLKTSEEENDSSKVEDETGSVKAAAKLVEPVKDYIHVRARRGQATDSHSLAERARREKISERMKVLQDLVPGCNKIIGKALVLDEIINYVQSLQRQVEFLSMKLEAVNSEMIPSMDGFLSKDVNQNGIPAFDPSGMMFSAQAARELAAIVAAGGLQSEWLHMQLGGSLE